MVVRTLSGGEVVIYGKATRVGSGFCSAARARQYIQHGCASYLADVVDTRVEEQISVSEVPIIMEFADVSQRSYLVCLLRGRLISRLILF